MNELKKLEAEYPELVTPDSPTQRVGGKPREGFVKAAHSSPMLSLDNTYSEDELRNWERRVRELSGRDEIEYVCELKLDGMSLALRYEEGKLVRGITRGDGSTGEDVTLNVRTVQSIPLSVSKEKLKKGGVPSTFEVRGEMLMPLAAFKKMNQEREQKGLSLFANPRNATAGTVRQLDPNVTAQRRLNYFAYMLLVDGRTYFDHHSKTLAALDIAGFKVNAARTIANNFAEVWTFIEQEETKRETLPYEIDGIVVKVDRTALQEELGYTVRLRAGPSLINTPRAGESRRLKTFWCRLAGRKTHSGGGVEAGAHRRNDRQPRHAPQHGRNRTPGGEDRRLGGSGARRRRDSQSCARRRRQRPSSRPQAISHAGALSCLWDEGCTDGRGSRLPLCQRQLSGKVAGDHSAFCVARGDEH